jgi:2-oxoglutarate ferredoxin oxidoreductase subunit alpha
MMVRNRATKLAKVADCIPELEVYGQKEADVLLVGWGGTYGHLYTATSQLLEEGRSVGFAQFDYINPLPKNTAEVFSHYKKILVCELNSGQFADYLRAKLPQFKYLQLNKVQGQPFMVHEIVDAVKAL